MAAPKYSVLSDGIVLETDAGSAFGSGDHPTTSLCMDMTEHFLKKGDRILDVGTGSGILMIAAAKLGAGKVLGIDKNETAVDIARKNLRLNKIDEQRFKVRTGNLVDGVKEQFELVLANILAEVIVTLLDNIQRILRKNGIFICSGMIEGNTHRVVAKMKTLGFEIIETRTKKKWVSIAGMLKNGCK